MTKDAETFLNILSKLNGKIITYFDPVIDNQISGINTGAIFPLALFSLPILYILYKLGKKIFKSFSIPYVYYDKDNNLISQEDLSKHDLNTLKKYKNNSYLKLSILTFISSLIILINLILGLFSPQIHVSSHMIKNDRIVANHVIQTPYEKTKLASKDYLFKDLLDIEVRSEIRKHSNTRATKLNLVDLKMILNTVNISETERQSLNQKEFNEKANSYCHINLIFKENKSTELITLRIQNKNMKYLLLAPCLSY